MKRLDLIRQILREDMPNLEKVRENCHKQAMYKPTARFRWQTAVAIATFVLLFSASVYAVGVIFFERFDTGGQFEILVVPEDDPEYWEQRENSPTSILIYESPNNNPPYRFIFAPAVEKINFAPKQASEINALLDGKLFTADGNPFPYDLIGTHVNTRGQFLFNENNEEIGYIRVWQEGSIPTSAEIKTVAEHDELYGYNDTFEEAANFLGADFRLPSVHMDGYDGPMYSLSQDTSNKIFVLYVTPEKWRHEAITIDIETVREEHEQPVEMRFPGAVERCFAIADTEVHKITGTDYAARYLWVHNDLVYSFYPPARFVGERMSGVFENIFSDEQIREIIESMIVSREIPE